MKLISIYLYQFTPFLLSSCSSSGQGRSQKFFEGGFWNFFVWKEKFRGGGRIFFSKKHIKLKKFSHRGGVFEPPSLNTPLALVIQLIIFLLNKGKVFKVFWMKFNENYLSIETRMLKSLKKFNMIQVLQKLSIDVSLWFIALNFFVQN